MHVRRQILLLLPCSLLLVFTLISLMLPSPVQAGGLQPILPGGSSIQPGEETQIQMLAEVVSINIRTATEPDNALIKLNPNIYPFQMAPVWFSAIAEVETDITLRNPTSNPVSMTVWFPLASALEDVEWKLYSGETVPRIESLQVNVDGKQIEYTVSELPNPKGDDKPFLPWASFLVTFPGQVETVIHLGYKVAPQPFPGIEMAFYYVFQTGASWAGPIGRVELTLNLPYPASSETIAGMPADSLRLPPYYRASMRANLSPNSMLERNQANFYWENLEPGPEDDFAVWLLQPDIWKELETAQTVVQANLQDGRAWLDLASTYTNHLGIEFNYLSVFSPYFLPAGIDAYQKAAAFLPGHPAPHAGLALLSLAPYIIEKNAPSDVIQYVQNEIQIARKLDAKNPLLMEAAGISRQLLIRADNALEAYFYNNAAADAALLETTSATPTMTIAFTATPISSTTPQPFRSPSPSVTSPMPAVIQQGNGTGNRQSMVIIVATGIIGLIVVGYIVWKRFQRRPEN
jgi:hypothetical protein